MKTYKSQAEVEADIVDGVLDCKWEDIEFECDISIVADIINAKNIIACNIRSRKIIAYNINARNINAWNINAVDINAWNINAWNINARNINAWDINAVDINAGDVDAWDINAFDINAKHISYTVICTAYNNIRCMSIESKREKVIYLAPQCIEGKLEIINNKEILMNFGQAIEKMKEGERVTRTGWNGKGMWIALQRPDEHSKMRKPYIYMCPMDGELVPWLASQTDMLAEDWKIYE